MYIECFKGNDGRFGSEGYSWYWRFVARNGKTVADAEAFPTKAHAIRAAKAVVRAVLKPVGCVDFRFNVTSESPDGVIEIRWS